MVVYNSICRNNVIEPTPSVHENEFQSVHKANAFFYLPVSEYHKEYCGLFIFSFLFLVNHIWYRYYIYKERVSYYSYVPKCCVPEYFRQKIKYYTRKMGSSGIHEQIINFTDMKTN